MKSYFKYNRKRFTPSILFITILVALIIVIFQNCTDTGFNVKEYPSLESHSPANTTVQVCNPGEKRPCSIEHGAAYEECHDDGSSGWQECKVVDCESGYLMEVNRCVLAPCENGATNPPSCNTCNSESYWNGQKCVPQVCSVQSLKDCTIPNGFGSKKCNIWGSGYENCQATSCRDGYLLKDNACVERLHRVTATPEKGLVVGATLNEVKNGQTASFAVNSLKGFVHHSLVGGNCPEGFWTGSIYTTGQIKGDCNVIFSSSACSTIPLSGPLASTTNGISYSNTFEEASLNMSYRGNSDLVVRRDGVSHPKYLEAIYRPDDRGSPRLYFFDGFPRGEEFTLNYRVRFNSPFDFARGGKIHGLSSRVNASGCVEVHPERWSVRLNFGKDGILYIYYYDQIRPNSCGATIAVPSFKFQQDRWYNLSLYVRVNTPGVSNGAAIVYIDGQKATGKSDLLLRNSSHRDSEIQTFLFSTFFGGSTADWAPSQTVSAGFERFIVDQGKKLRVYCSD